MKKSFKICSLLALSLTLGLAISACGKKKTTEKNSNETKVTTKSNSTKPGVSVNKTTKEALKSVEKGHFIINFVDDDDSIIDSISVKEGEMPSIPNDPVKDSDETYSYKFDGWDKEITVANKNETYKATYTSTFISYTVTFMDNNDNVISSDDYHYGDTVTIPSVDAIDHYSFIGWSTTKDGDVVEVGTVSKSITYYACYAIDKHTYTFYSEDGNDIIKSETINYGSLIEAPTNPTKDNTAQYTYNFIGWYTDKTDGVKVEEFGNIESDVTYYARFSSTTNKYTITWLDSDDSLIDTTEVNYGDMPTHSNPSKASTSQYEYTFSGWSPTLTSVVGDATYKANYNETVRKYTYTYYNFDGSIIKTGKVDYGTMVEAPTNPTYQGNSDYIYTFEGWYNKATGGTQVTASGKVIMDFSVYAHYTTTNASRTITYYTYEGSPVYKTITAPWGSSVTAPTAPTRSGYTFAGWSQSITTMPKTNTSVYGLWNAASYTLKVSVDTNWHNDVKYSGITSKSYSAGTSITLSIDSKTPTYTVKWDVNGVVYSGDSVTFAMPSKNTTVTISCIPYTVVSSTKIQMGMYPQSNVTSTMGGTLRKNAKSHINTSINALDKNYWYNMGGQTINGDVYNLWYIDVDLDDDGYMDYRGIYFDTYRPYDYSLAVSDSNTKQRNKDYYTGNFYWFKYEPITWIVSLNDSGKQYMYAEKILDGQVFYPSTSTSQVTHNGGTANPNTYRYSDLYAWMVNSFAYAFTSKQVQLLTTVSSSNTTIKYAVAEKGTVESGYVMGTDAKRKAMVTPYAECLGVYSNSYHYGDYWTSSASTGSANKVMVVDEDGKVAVDYCYRLMGIRPFIAFDTTKVTL